MAGTYNLNEGYVKNKNPRAGVANYKGNVLNIAQVDIIDEMGMGIGYMQGLTPSENRPTTLIRALSSPDAGRVLEQVPSPATITLSGTGFTLFDYPGQMQGSLVRRLAINNGYSIGAVIDTLEEQKIGFNLRMRVVHPETGGVLSLVEYQDCWLTSHSVPYNISNATISETVNISASRKNTLPIL